MWIMTKDGWRRLQCKDVVAAPPEPPRITRMNCWQDHGFKSYLGWLRNEQALKE